MTKKAFEFSGMDTISIHTPTQGVTSYGVVEQGQALISIHTPTQGVTDKVDMVLKMYDISIHTPTQGVTGIFQTVCNPD